MLNNKEQANMFKSKETLKDVEELSKQLKFIKRIVIIQAWDVVFALLLLMHGLS